MDATFKAKLDAFVALAEKETHERMEANGFDSLLRSAKEQGRRTYYQWGYDEKGTKRFVRVWRENGTQPSVAYFVERDTGVIFGAKGWKAYNPNHEYGTLDTIDEYMWGEHYGSRKDGVATLVPKENRR